MPGYFMRIRNRPATLARYDIASNAARLARVASESWVGMGSLSALYRVRREAGDPAIRVSIDIACNVTIWQWTHGFWDIFVILCAKLP